MRTVTPMGKKIRGMYARKANRRAKGIPEPVFESSREVRARRQGEDARQINKEYFEAGEFRAKADYTVYLDGSAREGSYVEYDDYAFDFMREDDADPHLLQDKALFDRVYNDKNVFFRPHIHFGVTHNREDYTFGEKVMLQVALNEVTKISMIAMSLCDVVTLPLLLQTPGGKIFDIFDLEFVQSLDAMFSDPCTSYTIYDLRGRDGGELVNASYSEMRVQQTRDNGNDWPGIAIYIGSDFFDVTISSEERVLILYYAFIKTANWITSMGNDFYLASMNDHSALLLFKDILESIKYDR